MRRARCAARRLHRDAACEEGSALVEFCWLGVLLLIPLTWVLLAVFRAQGTAYAVTAATREAGRAYVSTSGSGTAAQARAEARAVAAASVALRDFGAELDRRELDITGSLRPGSAVTVELTASVPLPFVPQWLGGSSVRVHGRHVELVDQYR
ncbi:hypothetical protein [Motilibacter deserti]|uniref:Flp pilus assembly protein TadG n=1 Tax=Motilibacter deserti TaxID=2714956 RepID=A0ABX0GR25_9ACTN|nr:hypothetical protein [Motilibacter deserti]NHC12923.1 hypothetical protein [Motilibacter deserti]